LFVYDFPVWEGGEEEWGEKGSLGSLKIAYPKCMDSAVANEVLGARRQPQWGGQVMAREGKMDPMWGSIFFQRSRGKFLGGGGERFLVHKAPCCTGEFLKWGSSSQERAKR